MHRRLWGLLAIAALTPLLFTAQALATRPKPQPCPGGRFVVLQNQQLIVGGSITPVTDAVVVQGVQIAIGSGCPPMPGKVKATKKGTKVTDKWAVCGSLQKVHLKALIEPDCNTMAGTLTAKRTKPSPFQAKRSFCGDGIIDRGGGEACDSGMGCANGEVCRETCACVLQVGPTTTLAPTTSTSTIRVTTTTLPSSSTSTTHTTTSTTTSSATTSTPTSSSTSTSSTTQTTSTTTTTTTTSTSTTTLRFVDNGDGTVTDQQTRLQWEKKVVGNRLLPCRSVHCVDNTYTWSASGTGPDGTAFTSFLNTLNGGATGVGNCASADGSTITGGFNNHCDWRLPTVAELATIVDTSVPQSLCIDPIFGPTQAALYWSSTSSGPGDAWLVSFNCRGVVSAGGSFAFAVRAVRGGS